MQAQTQVEQREARMGAEARVGVEYSPKNNAAVCCLLLLLVCKLCRQLYMKGFGGEKQKHPQVLKASI
jgi:hypothetical protein